MVIERSKFQVELPEICLLIKNRKLVDENRTYEWVFVYPTSPCLTNEFSDDFNSLGFYFGVLSIKISQEKKVKEIKKI